MALQQIPRSIIAVTFFLASCGTGISEEMVEKHATEAANKAVFEQLLMAWSTGDPSMVDELLAEDFVTHNPDPNVEGSGKLNWIGAMRLYKGQFPDMQIDKKIVFADGDWVAGAALVSGTNEGILMGMPPTGRSMKVTSLDLIRFKEGKAVEHWGLFDALTMMQQLGLDSAAIGSAQ